jgi:hypothetical protein
MGTVGTFFLKYLVWGILTVITFGIFAFFLPVKNFKLEKENIIDHEHTDKALLRVSEYRNSVQNTVSMNKNFDTEYKMEGLNAGINDTTKEKELLKLANDGLRSAQYLYVVKYGEEKTNEEPFDEFLKASAQAGYAPAMCLYARTHSMEEEAKNEMLSKAAEQGQIPSIRNRMNYNANMGLDEANSNASISLLEKAVFYADVLEKSGEELTDSEKENIKKCVLKIRRIESGKKVLSKTSAGVIVAAVAAVVLFFAIIFFGLMAIFGLKMGKAELSPRPNEATDIGGGVEQGVTQSAYLD